MLATARPTSDDANSSSPSWLERQLAILGQLAEIGLGLAQSLERKEAEADAAQSAGMAVAFGRISRAVRLTIALQAKLIADANAPTSADDTLRRAERRAQVTRIVRRVVGENGGDPMETAWRKVEASERLEHDDIYGDILARPVSEIIAEVCHDLGVRPDWARLATEGWARDEVAGGSPGAPLARRRAPIAARFIAAEGSDEADDDEDFDDDS